MGPTLRTFAPRSRVPAMDNGLSIQEVIGAGGCELRSSSEIKNHHGVLSLAAPFFHPSGLRVVRTLRNSTRRKSATRNGAPQASVNCNVDTPEKKCENSSKGKTLSMLLARAKFSILPVCASSQSCAFETGGIKPDERGTAKSAERR